MCGCYVGWVGVDDGNSFFGFGCGWFGNDLVFFKFFVGDCLFYVFDVDWNVF